MAAHAVSVMVLGATVSPPFSTLFRDSLFALRGTPFLPVVEGVFPCSLVAGKKEEGGEGGRIELELDSAGEPVEPQADPSSSSSFLWLL